MVSTQLKNIRQIESESFPQVGKGEKKKYLKPPPRYDMGVSKNRETPQNGWFIMENPIKWMIWEENPLFSETSI